MTPPALPGHKKGPAGSRTHCVSKRLPPSSHAAPTSSHGADLEALDQHHAAAGNAHRGAFELLALAAAIRCVADQSQLTPGQLLHIWQPEPC